jgi:hypothetical protein
MKGKSLIWKKHNIFLFLCLSLPLSLSPTSPHLSFSSCFSLSLSLLFSLSHSLFSTLSLTFPRPFSLHLSPFLSLSAPLSLSHTLCLSLSLYLSFFLSLSIYLSLSLPSLSVLPFSPLNSSPWVKCNFDLNLVVGQCSIVYSISPGEWRDGDEMSRR